MIWENLVCSCVFRCYRKSSEIVRYADLSLNSEIATLEALSDAALTQEKNGVILMVEMGICVKVSGRSGSCC